MREINTGSIKLLYIEGKYKSFCFNRFSKMFCRHGRSRICFISLIFVFKLRDMAMFCRNSFLLRGFQVIKIITDKTEQKNRSHMGFNGRYNTSQHIRRTEFLPNKIMNQLFYSTLKVWIGQQDDISHLCRLSKGQRKLLC